jgi:protein O-mannosyl-transferase
MYRYLTQWIKENAGLLVLLAVAFAIYAPGFKGELVVDDVFILKDNAYIDHGSIARFFSSRFWDNVANQGGDTTAMYRPLDLVYFWLLHKVWGAKPLGYHICLTLLHLANMCLVYAVARRMFAASAVAAAIGAAIFALHPARVESVAWISGVPDPLVTFFLLGGLLAHHAFAESRKEWRYLVVAACCFQFALWCKEVAVIFPLVVVAIDWIIRRKINWPSAATYIALLAGYFVARSFALDGAALWENINPTQFSRAFDLALGYGKLLIFPTEVPFYLQPPQHQMSSILGWCAIALIISAVLIAWRMLDAEGRKRLALAVVWMAGFSWTAILMMFYLEGFYSARFLYVPAVGMAFFVALFYDRLVVLRAGLKIPVFVFCCIVISAYGVVASREIPIWHDELTLYQRMTKSEPEGTVGFMNLGYTLISSGNYAKAEENFQIALRNARIPRTRAEALVGLGTVAGMTNDLSRSASYLNEAVRVDPNNSLAWTGLGNLAWMRGQLDEAIPFYEKALAIRPRNYEAAMNLATVYEQTGQVERGTLIRNSIRK